VRPVEAASMVAQYLVGTTAAAVVAMPAAADVLVAFETGKADGGKLLAAPAGGRGGGGVNCRCPRTPPPRSTLARPRDGQGGGHQVGCGQPSLLRPSAELADVQLACEATVVATDVATTTAAVAAAALTAAADMLVFKAGEVANDRLLILYSSDADVLSTSAAARL